MRTKKRKRPWKALLERKTGRSRSGQHQVRCQVEGTRLRRKVTVNGLELGKVFLGLCMGEVALVEGVGVGGEQTRPVDPGHLTPCAGEGTGTLLAAAPILTPSSMGMTRRFR